MGKISQSILHLVVGSACFFYTTLVYAETTFLVFSEINLVYDNKKSFSEKNVSPALDAFFSSQHGNLLTLVEASFTEEQQHFERLQIGLNIKPGVIWFGRYHNPSGYWHTQYHHGTFLQTAISRPAMAEFTADGGILPSHYSGFLFEGDYEYGESLIEYTLATGLTSRLGNAGMGHGGDGSGSGYTLHDFDPLDKDPENYKMGYTFRLSFFPNSLEDNQYGGFVSRSTIMDERVVGKNIKLNVIGLFANHEVGDTRFIAEIYHVATRIPMQNTDTSGRFVTMYMQAEYNYNDQFTPYIRYEDTYSDEGDAYLELLSGFSKKAATIGLRWDFKSNQGLKFEYRKHHFEADKDAQWSLNWSAVWL